MYIEAKGEDDEEEEKKVEDDGLSNSTCTFPSANERKMSRPVVCQIEKART